LELSLFVEVSRCSAAPAALGGHLRAHIEHQGEIGPPRLPVELADPAHHASGLLGIVDRRGCALVGQTREIVTIGDDDDAVAKRGSTSA